MADAGHVKTEKMLGQIESKLNKLYSQAASETKEKYLKYVEKFQKKEAEKRALLDSGKITQEQFNKWRESAIFSGKQYQNLANTMARDLTMTNQKAMSIVNGYIPEAYALNRNYAMYQLEMDGVQLGAMFTLYDRHTVEYLVKRKGALLPKPKVDIPKDLRWNRAHIKNAIAQGVLQGESIPKIAKRLQKVVGMNKVSAIRNARTAMTGAQNAGRIDSYNYAQKELGVNVMEEWLASGDGLTRESHAEISGERIKMNEVFSNGCEYPGDPGGAPEEVYNCRCTLLPYLPDYEEKKQEEKPEKDAAQDFSEWVESKLRENRKDKFEPEKFSYAVDVDGVNQRDVYEAWKNLCPKLTPEEAEYRDVYVQTSDSFRINKAFREAGANVEGKSVYEILTEHDGIPAWVNADRFAKNVEGLDALIEKNHLQKDTILTRLVSDTYANNVLGIEQGNLASVIANFETDAVQTALNSLVGTEVTEYGFMSTAGAIDNRFQAFGRRNIVLRLYTPEGTPALYVNPDELEVVLGRGTKYTIKGFGVEEHEREWGGKIKRLIVNCYVGE